PWALEAGDLESRREPGLPASPERLPVWDWARGEARAPAERLALRPDLERAGEHQGRPPRAAPAGGRLPGLARRARAGAGTEGSARRPDARPRLRAARLRAPDGRLAVPGRARAGVHTVRLAGRDARAAAGLRVVSGA